MKQTIMLECNASRDSFYNKNLAIIFLMLPEERKKDITEKIMRLPEFLKGARY